MTLYQITSYLKQIALSSPYIRTAEEGSVYTIMNGNPHSRYGVFVISQTQHRQDDIFDYYGFNMFVIDRLVDDLESNRLQIQSLAKEVLANTILTLITKFYGITHNELQFHPFTEKFVDLTAGQYVQVTFQVPRNLICPDDYNLDFNPEYVLEPLVVEITENGIFEYEPEDIDGYNKVTVTVNVDIPDNYESGFTSGVTYQKSLLVPTAFTENGVYSTENGYSEVTVNVDTDAYYNSGYTDGIGSGITYQKSLIIPLTVDENGVYEREDGYNPVTVSIDTDAYYNSGYTDGIGSGITYQKSLLSAITIDHNGEFTSENGYSAITVNVPQTGASINNQTKSVEYTQNGDYSVNYDNGYTGLESVNINVNVPQTGYTQEDLLSAYTSGITYQKSLLSAVTFTQNGTYTRQNGYSAVTVNVNTSAWYNSGKTDQKALLSAATFTSNGTYTRANGYSAVTVNVNMQPAFDSGATNGYSDRYLTFKILSGGTLIWKAAYTNHTRAIEYSKNNGTWKEVRSTTGGKEIVDVVRGDVIRFRGNNLSYEDSSNYHNYFAATENTVFSVFGNIMSLVYGDNFTDKKTLVSAATFCSLFYDCTGLTSSSNLVLPATTLTPRCYMKMFSGCTNMVSSPKLPATTLANNCYEGMFGDCTKLNETPYLYATTLASFCYKEMFKNCDHINYIKCLATDISATDCTLNWTQGIGGGGTNTPVKRTFVKAPSMKNWTQNSNPQPPANGIPVGWAISEE